MIGKLGEVTLTEKELEQACKVLEDGCSGEVTIVFSHAKLIGVDVSEGFSIEPKSVHCMYGCKNQEDIKIAIEKQKGIVVPEKC